MKLLHNYRVLSIFILVLFGFLTLTAYLVASQQRDLLRTAAHSRAEYDLDLMADASLEALLKSDYVTVRTLVERWGHGHTDIRQLRVVVANGYVLAEHLGNAPAEGETYSLSKEVRISNHLVATLSLVGDYREAERMAADLKTRLILAAVIITSLLGAALWLTIRKLALAPLEKMVGERTRDLTVIVQELEAKNTELERFTYTVSHDLKSPIITIKGFLGMLVADAKAGKIERMEADIKRIGNAADKMQFLLDDLLELSRIGRVVNPPEEFSMTVVAREAVELLHGSLQRPGVEIVIDPDLPQVYGDKQRIREVLQNLIENALKFGRSQAALRIGIGCRFLDGVNTFFVKDNGIGLEEKFHEKIFGLFDKLDPASPGTGIGLALVKRIIELHHGKIWVESAGVGQGATFCFTLPEKKDMERRAP